MTQYLISKAPALGSPATATSKPQYYATLLADEGADVRSVCTVRATGLNVNSEVVALDAAPADGPQLMKFLHTYMEFRSASVIVATGWMAVRIAKFIQAHDVDFEATLVANAQSVGNQGTTVRFDLAMIKNLYPAVLAQATDVTLSLNRKTPVVGG